MTDLHVRINVRINARMMPRTRAETALKKLNWAITRQKELFQSVYDAHMRIGERNINQNWNVYREDAGVSSREFDRIIERDAGQLAHKAVLRSPYLGIGDYQAAILKHALHDWAAEMGMHPRCAPFLQYYLFPTELPFDWDLPTLKRIGEQNAMKYRALPD